MLWMITLCQISSFLSPVAAGMVALMAFSLAGQCDLWSERAGVLSLVISLISWLVVNSILAIRGFLIAELIAFLMVRLLGLFGRAVPFLSMTIVLLRLVKTEGIAVLFVGGVVVGVVGALAAFWALVRVGSGAIVLDRGVVVVAGAGCLLYWSCSSVVRVVI